MNILKTNGNFEKLVKQSADDILDPTFRALYEHIRAGYTITEDTLFYHLKEVKATLKKDLRRNWKPQAW